MNAAKAQGFHIIFCFVLVVASASVAAPPKATRDGSSAASQPERPASENVDWGALFRMHYANRVKAFQEHNLVFGNVVFVGDSITEGFDLAKHFPGRRVLNRGIGGDVIGNALPPEDQRGVLRRLDCSVYDCAPSHVVLCIGANDVNIGHSPSVMEQGYRQLLQEIKHNAPRVKVVVLSVFPMRGVHASKNPVIVEFNKLLEPLAKEFGYEYLNLHSLFSDPKGELQEALTEDGLHLTAAAYVLWRREIEKTLGWHRPE